VAQDGSLIMESLSVVLLTSRALGLELGAALSGMPEVRSLTVITTRVVSRQSLYRKFHRMYLHEGVRGVLDAARRRMRAPSGGARQELAALVAEKCPGATHIHHDDLHSPESLAYLRAVAPDLGIVFATYRLRPEVFNIPRMGSLNLHLGRAPEFRGSSPGFYEMLEGVPEVGVTVHRVSEKLDEGPILLQETFPLDIAPAGDPMQYLKRYQAEVLLPQGIRLMVQAVHRLARGASQERAQGSGARPRPRATYRLQQELRRRVAERRSAAGARARDSVPVRN
jgi:folate-dependent phosphoribosylglycinamide formyltransferase PurN